MCLRRSDDVKWVWRYVSREVDAAGGTAIWIFRRAFWKRFDGDDVGGSWEVDEEVCLECLCFRFLVDEGGGVVCFRLAVDMTSQGKN